VRLPLLRKDFLYDRYQLWRRAKPGLMPCLLIAAMLEPSQVADLVAEAAEIGLDVLLEVHDERELEMALQVPVELVGINNRDLRTFHTDLAVTERLAPRIPAERLVVAESGIASRADVQRLQTAGPRFS